MNAETVANALGGYRSGSHWMARCPAHEDQRPSLSIRDAENGRLLVHCHAGCDQMHVIREIRRRGLWTEVRHRVGASSVRPPSTSGSRKLSGNERRAAALRIWQTASDPVGTLVERYLLSRGLSMPIPKSIRFHPRLKHPAGGVWPGMVSLVTSGTDEKAMAIHRTFLTQKGSGKAPVQPQKMMLGPCRGGVVRLGFANKRLLVGEGLETCLAAMIATESVAWAALSTSGLRSLQLPPESIWVTILADGDEAGEAAAQFAARRWKHEGRKVRIARPPSGMDFNDVLLAEISADGGVVYER